LLQLVEAMYAEVIGVPLRGGDHPEEWQLQVALHLLCQLDRSSMYSKKNAMARPKPNPKNAAINNPLTFLG